MTFLATPALAHITASSIFVLANDCSRLAGTSSSTSSENSRAFA
ncbi:hypothetical protein [Lactococcus lactis]|nr:hypothetical protein [Lactococcus lactis]MDV4192413.1 hypothetical protein [Lactococcus lactis subsp. lactis]